MSGALKQRVEARDRLVLQAEAGGLDLHDSALAALRRGDLRLVEAAILRHDAHVRTLVENLRIYQAELHAQADELAASQSRTEELLDRFSTLFSNMPVAALLVAHSGAVIEHNEQAAALFNLAARAAPLIFLHRMVAPTQYQERVRPALHEARAHGRCALQEVEFIGHDGRRFLGELHIAALPGGADGPGPLACAVIDSTAHLNDLRALRESAEALRVSEAFLADSARLARVGGWEYSAVPPMLRWSREARAVLEADDDDTADGLGATLALCAPASRSAFVAALDGAARNGRPFELELDMLTLRGHALRVRAVGHRDDPAADRDDNGDRADAAPAQVFGVFQDITQQHLARQQIGDLTERLGMAKDAGGIGIWDWDVGTDRLFLDDRMCELLGLAEAPPSDLRSAVESRLAPDAMPVFATALRDAVEQQRPLSVELRLAAAAADGSERWLHLTGRAHADGQGHPGMPTRRLVGCAWDSSPQKQAARVLVAKELAESASLAKSAFLSRMSHELRTPLNAILGFSQLMRLEADAGDLRLKPHRVALIETAARHLLDLINEVLDVSRIESGQVELRLQRLDLRELVRESLPLVLQPAEAAGVTIADATADGPPLWVLADRLRLKQVLINLLSNAVKYNRPQGRVDIVARVDGDGVEIDVGDSGQGLSAAQIGNLFQPFNRLGAEASGIEGSGMGLFVSKRFVELMGGRIGVRSEPAVGTTFSVRLAAPTAA